MTERYKVIMVDDNVASLVQGKILLKDSYKCFTVMSAEELFRCIGGIMPDLILLDVMMPGVDGYEAIERLKADVRYRDIPVVFLTSKDDVENEVKGLSLGAADYITKPFSGPLLQRRILNQIILARAQAAMREYADGLEIKVQQQVRERTGLHNGIINTIADFVEVRDHCTGGHVQRTQRYMRAMMDALREGGPYRDEALALNPDLVALSTQLHDVGKIGISDAILNKPGKLTPEEFEVMKTHTAIGVDIIGKIMDNTNEQEYFRHAMQIAGTHHERWDGTGYPAGLSGEGIPLVGRLMAICDVYDALISERPYKAAAAHSDAVEAIAAESGGHFDPCLVDALLGIQGIFAEIASGG